MIVIASALIGILTGAITAARRKGSIADIAQYAAGFGIAFTLLGLILTIAIEKIMM